MQNVLAKCLDIMSNHNVELAGNTGIQNLARKCGMTDVVYQTPCWKH